MMVPGGWCWANMILGPLFLCVVQGYCERVCFQTAVSVLAGPAVKENGEGR